MSEDMKNNDDLIKVYMGDRQVAAGESMDEVLADMSHAGVFEKLKMKMAARRIVRESVQEGGNPLAEGNTR